ncbi:MAG: hypothetical protein WBD95_29530 [Xanthobacteraceae bacterium]
MAEILDAIANTPLWFYAAAAVVLWLGARNLSVRESRLGTLFVHPVIVLVLEIANLAGSAAPAVAIPAFMISFAVGGAIGWKLAPHYVVAGRASSTVHVRGSVAPLLVAIAVVVLRYSIGYTYNTWPELRTDPALALQFSAIGALLVGVVWGRIVCIVSVYRRAPARYLHLGRAPW